MEGLKAKTGSLYDGEAREIAHVKNVTDLVSKVSTSKKSHQIIVSLTRGPPLSAVPNLLCGSSGLVQAEMGWNQGQILTASWCARVGFGSEKCCKYEQGRNLAILKVLHIYLWLQSFNYYDLHSLTEYAFQSNVYLYQKRYTEDWNEEKTMYYPYSDSPELRRVAKAQEVLSDVGLFLHNAELFCHWEGCYSWGQKWTSSTV